MSAEILIDAKGETLRITGEVVFDTVVAIQEQGLNLMRSMKKVQVDLNGLKDCDSSVLVLCTGWVREMHKQKKSILFLNLPPFMKDLVRVHGLELVLPISQ
jgi:ABC-type transporter Mla MlaB component